MEHRLLCLHILCKRTSSECAKNFVKFSGLKLLRRWLKSAEEEDRIHEIRFILAACKTLPFDTEAIKHSEIGKAIKKLLKYKGTNASSGDVNVLTEEVKSLMKQWTEKIEGDDGEVPVTKTSSGPTDAAAKPNIVSKLAEAIDYDSKSREIGKFSAESKESAVVSVKTEEKPAAPAANTLASRFIANSKAQPITTSSISAGTSGLAILDSLKGKPSNQVTSPISWLKNIASGNPSMGLSIPASNVPAIPRDRKNNDAMVEEAKRRLAMHPDGEDKSGKSDSDSKVAPLKSSLKKRADAGNLKRQKLSVLCKFDF